MRINQRFQDHLLLIAGGILLGSLLGHAAALSNYRDWSGDVRRFADRSAVALGLVGGFAAVLAWIRPLLALSAPLIAVPSMLFIVDVFGPGGFGIDIAYVSVVAGGVNGAVLAYIATRLRKHHRAP